MKCFSLIYLCYLMVLFFVPCTDNQHQHEFDLTEHTKNESRQGDETDEMDTCSPFCVCNCCHIIVGQPEVAGQWVVPFEYEQSHSKHYLSDNQLYTLFSGEIWQPPKMRV